MKPIKISPWASLMAAAILFTACEGDDFGTSFLEAETEVSNRYLQAEATLSNTYRVVDKALRDPTFRALDSAVVDFAIVTRAGNQVTINFGNGTIGPDGFVRRGAIEINEPMDYRITGGSVTVDLDKYILNEFDVKGILSLQNYASDSMGLTLNNFVAIDSLEVSAARRIQWVSGFNTAPLEDDKYWLRGSAHGDYAGGNLNTIITSPLFFDQSCQHHILSGIIDLDLQPDTADAVTGTIDFIQADGCENLSKLKLKRGDQEISLARQFLGF